MDVLKLIAPQNVEQLRVDASNYANLMLFFDELKSLHAQYQFDPDLIINVDETTTNAEKTKLTTRVLYDPSLNVSPVTTYGGKLEHVTLCSAITASGKSLTPMFIIKNKTVSSEASLRGPDFDCGDYALAYSPNGWQDSVSANIVIALRVRIPPWTSKICMIPAMAGNADW